MPGHEAFRLRAMEQADLDLVLTWRNQKRIRQAMYTDHIISREEHYAWFERVSGQDESLHFVFEYEGKPIGVANVTDINRAANRCVWGFYIGAEDVPRGVGSAMGFFTLEHLFETLGFHKVIGEALAENEASIRYHLRLGFVQEGRFVEHVIKKGRFVDVISFAVLERDWKRIKPELAEMIFENGG